MANEASIAKGSYAALVSSFSIAEGAFSSAGTLSTAITTAAEQLYPTLDFKLDVNTATGFAAGDSVNLYRVAGDGTDQAPVATSTNKQQYVGSFTIASSTADEYYLYGVANVDINDQFMIESDPAGTTTTLAGNLLVRARTVKPAA